ncbi:hypothetical protein [Candidatus Arsenophonus triatominarum]|uniref:hypothetical protein n=1 Tax=Candidatus Arsenophonus triatominarum TaxID=57911 RepID=UPI00094082BC|nr:hypothetical protein [Candidatus Arsenophonus triatominarum]
MQYSKQELINIALPKEIIGEAKEIKTINVKVNKTKYGLKDIKWIVDHHFSTDGGRIQKNFTD